MPEPGQYVSGRAMTCRSESRFGGSRVRVVFSFLWIISLLAGVARAQESGAEMPAHHSAHDMQNMGSMNMSMSGADWMPSPHAGSGTSWQPASVPEYFWMTSREQWDLMAHGILFLTY